MFLKRSMRKRLVISASMRYRDLVREVIRDLDALDIDGVFPNLEISMENRDVAETIAEKLRLAQEHFEAMCLGNGIYLLAPEGYIGTSGKIELGYALAIKKPIYLSEPTNQPDIDCFAREVISLDNLKRFREVL